MTVVDAPVRLEPLSIRASAGSGKTYELTNRYLRLVSAGARVDSVLATTFTRLAAGEIRDRLLVRLVEATESTSAREQLRLAIERETLTADDAQALLRHLAGNVHRMQVRTIDSFFGAVARSFALELGLPPGGAILEEEEAISLRMEAIDRVFEHTDTTRLGPLLRRLTEGDVGRSAWGAVERVVGPLYDLYREAPPAAWERLAPQEELGGEELGRAIEAVDEVAVPDHKGVQKQRRALVAAAMAGRWEDVLGHGLVTKIAGGETTYYGRAITPEMVAAVRPLRDHARAALTNRLRYRLLAMRELLDAYHEAYVGLKHDAGLVTFDDITFALAREVEHRSLEEIYYRVDARIHHLLLDEFQDTSMLQWRALSPIVEELLADRTAPRSFFVVGDGKQSIYGWRNACPDILATIPEQLGIGTEPLNVSWRSSPPVLDAVNAVFTTLDDSPALAKEEDQEAAVRFARDFEPHHASARTRGMSGRVELHVADVDPEVPLRERTRSRLREAAALARTLHDGAPGAEVAILVRSNAAVTRVLYELGRLDVPASGRGGSPLVDAPPVEAILDLLRFADHPDDTVSLFNVVAGPLGAFIDLTVSDCARPRRERRCEVARGIRQRLIGEGYAAVIAGWVAGVAASCDARQYARLEQLVALAAAYEPRATLRTGPFVKLVETRRVEAARTALVQAMTVHQAKGLGFDAVILPDLDWSLAGNRPPPAAWRRASTLGHIDAIVPWLQRKQRAHFPDLAPLYAADRTRRVQEGLCLLYVAMTRAKQGLFMLVDPKSKTGSAASVVRAALAPGDGAAPGSVPFERGDDDWASTLPAAPEAVTAPEAAPPLSLAQPAGAIGRDAAAPASALARRLADALQLEDADAMDRGRAIHALFEQIAWLDGTPDARTLAAWRAHAARAVPRRDDAWLDAIMQDFRAAIERPTVRELLRRDPLLPVEVRREHPYALIAEDDDEEIGGRVQEGTIDRLEIWRDARGKAAGARVIDFKTDRIGASQAPEHAERYRRQLEAYRAVTARIHGLPRDRVEMVVLFVEAGVAVGL